MVNGKDTAKPKDIEDKPSSEVITAMEELLHLFEGVVNSNKTTKDDFYTLLKKRFLELADTYEFLDPFGGEFAYSDGTVRFTGKAKDEAMIKGILTAVTGLAGELGLASQFQTKAAAWFLKHSAKLKSFGIDR